MKEARSIAPVMVESAPLMQNVSSGKDVNIGSIPTPRWHEHDGGYYIGTGCMVIMKDPDTGWINYGAYRVQSHGPSVATVMCSKGKHGDLIKRRYHERGEPCPIAVVVGMHPALFMVAGLEIPYGKNEYDVAGGFAQGLGGALLEEFTYNERGDPLATTFADYLMPTVRETPEVEVILREEYTSPLNPLGIKGAGESGITGVGAAIASAIDDAIGMPGAVTQLPVTPQRLKQILNARRSAP